ncbi:MAG: metal-dependent hydrolase [Myxococcota bacterium]
MSSIDVRDLRFDLRAVPRDWHPGGAAITAYWDQLSVFFPLGESFFVRSVKHFLPQLTDERLRADVIAFCAQEGHHAREHRAYNERLAAEGLPVAALERIVDRVLRVAQRFSPRRQLAITCALEHFTSLMGEVVLGRPEVLAGADPTMAKLWRWHSAEENEHRSVAFDVFVAVGGTRLERSRSMLITSAFFWSLVSLHLVLFLAKRGALFSPREHWRLFRFLWLEPAAIGSLVKPWLSYFSKGFHPAQRGGEELIEAWKREYSAA